MSKFIKKYSTEAQYVSDATVERMKSGEFPLPNVGYVEESKGVHYNKKREFLELKLYYNGGDLLDGDYIDVYKSESSDAVTVEILPTTASNKNVIWTVGDASIVSVTGSGSTFTLNGLNVGETTVTCTTVADPSASITFNFNCMKLPTIVSFNSLNAQNITNTAPQSQTYFVWWYGDIGTSTSIVMQQTTQQAPIWTYDENDKSLTIRDVGAGVRLTFTSTWRSPSVDARTFDINYYDVENDEEVEDTYQTGQLINFNSHRIKIHNIIMYYEIPSN